MSRPVLHRAFADAGELEVRSDQRTILGIAVPFDTPTAIVDRDGSYDEQFRRGAFARTIAERTAQRVKALAQHNHALLPVGRAQLLREDRHGLYCELRISRTQLGDEVLELVRDGALDSLSIGFEPISEDRSTHGVITRTEVKLREISCVAFPAYEGAAISGVRAQQGTPARDHARERTTALRTRFQEYLR